MRRAVLLLVAVLIIAVLAGTLVWRQATGPPDVPIASGPVVVRPRPASATAFASSVGVNIHVSYYDTAYARFDEWSRLLQESGIRRVRDSAVLDDPEFLRRQLVLAQLGMRASLIMFRLDRAADSVAFAAGPLRPLVETIEGPNEPDFSIPGDWPGALRTFMPAIRDANERTGLRVPLLGPSFVEPGSRDRVADLASTWDVENIHPYPGGYQPAANMLDRVRTVRGYRPAKPIVATEAGYHNGLESTVGQPGVSEAAAASYVPRTYLETFSAGITRTYLYELIDEKPNPDLTDAEQHFGLLRNDLTPKPAYSALRNLLRAVASSPGDGEGRGVLVRGSRDLRTLLLRRDDGSSILLLWRRVDIFDPRDDRPTPVRPTTAGVDFDGVAEDVRVLRPTSGAGPAQESDRARGLNVPVGGDVVAISYR